MGNTSDLRSKRIIYASSGFLLGISAPIAWTLIRLILFPDPNLSLYVQIFSDITRTPYNMALYAYMGIGTAIVMAILGYYIGKAGDELQVRAVELDALHREVASQKEVFEHRYKVLDNNIKNFHNISSRIQNSMDSLNVLTLCAEGLHDVLGYERVNILIADETRSALQFVAATGSIDYDTAGVKLPLDPRSGVIYKCFAEKKLYLIDDIANHPAEFHLQPPYDAIKPLRSRNFVLCPIVVKGESIGVFGIDNKFSYRSLNDTDVDTVKLFADQAASAINRINLLQAISALTDELEKTFAGLLGNREVYSRNVHNLKGAVGSMVDDTSNIATAANGVMEAVDDTRSAVGEISVTIDQVAKNLDYLSESIEKSVSAMTQINASIKNVEQSAALSHSVSMQVKSEADMGKDAVQETISALAEIQNSVELAYDGVSRLSANSRRIDNIVDVINEITKKTNLLALNASIIAAQAGEYGKSFGVVADEIRNLSVQTGQSTYEITGIIEEIQSESRHAAENIASTKTLVQKGVEIGGQMKLNLQVIQESATRSMDMTEEIKIATEEQVKSVSLVTQSIEDVSTMSSQILNASKEQANGTKSIARAVDSIMEMAEQMVQATERQVKEGEEIKNSVEVVGSMAEEIFEDMEKRRLQSLTVVNELEGMKRIS